MGHENAEGMAHVGVRLTAQLGRWPMIIIVLAESRSVHDGGHSIVEDLQS